MDLGINKIKIGDIVVESNQNFLIIDDEGDILDTIEDILEMLGFKGKILKAASINEAKKHLKFEKIDYIVSDWNLPDGQGIALLKAIRKSYKFRDIPFLMITGDDTVDNMILSQKYGSSDFLAKPFHIDNFERKIAEGWSTHVLPKQDEFHALKQRIVELEEEIEYLKDRLKATHPSL